MVLEFVEGTPLDEWLPRQRRHREAGAARAAGLWLAQLHRGSPPADRAPAPSRYGQRLRAVLRRMRSARLLGADVVAALGSLTAPASAASAVTHGDICPENCDPDAGRPAPPDRRGAARGPSTRLRSGADHQPLAAQCAPRGRLSRRIRIRRWAAGGVSEASDVLDCRCTGDERRVPVAAAVEAATHSRSAACPCARSPLSVGPSFSSFTSPLSRPEL